MPSPRTILVPLVILLSVALAISITNPYWRPMAAWMRRLFRPVKSAG